MIAFLGLDRAGRALGTIGNAPRAIRADQLGPLGVTPALRPMPVRAVPRLRPAERLPGPLTMRTAAVSRLRDPGGGSRRRRPCRRSWPQPRSPTSPDHPPRDPAPARRAGAGAAGPGAADRPERGRAAAAERVPGRLHPAARPLAADRGARRQRAPVRSLQPEHAQGRPADLRGLFRRAVRDLRHGDRAALDAGAGRHPDRRARQPRRLRRYRAAAVQRRPC